MKRRDGEEDNSPYVFCEQCDQMFERVFIQQCSFCFKDFCRNCAVRSGNAAFCSKVCARAWFFTEADEEEAAEAAEDDKGKT